MCLLTLLHLQNLLSHTEIGMFVHKNLALNSKKIFKIFSNVCVLLSNIVKHRLHVCLLHSRLEGAGQNCHEPPEAGAPLDVLLVFIDESVGGAERVLRLLLALKDRVLNKKIFSTKYFECSIIPLSTDLAQHQLE